MSKTPTKGVSQFESLNITARPPIEKCVCVCVLKLRPGEVPWMVSYHPQDGHPPFKIYQKEVYYRLGIWHLDLTHKIKTR